MFCFVLFFIIVTLLKATQEVFLPDVECVAREAAAGHLQGQAVANKVSLLLSRVNTGATCIPHQLLLPGAYRKMGALATVGPSLAMLSQMCLPGICASCWAFRWDGMQMKGAGESYRAVQPFNWGETWIWECFTFQFLNAALRLDFSELKCFGPHPGALLSSCPQLHCTLWSANGQAESWGWGQIVNKNMLGTLAEGSQTCKGFWTSAFPRQQKLSRHTLFWPVSVPTVLNDPVPPMPRWGGILWEKRLRGIRIMTDCAWRLVEFCTLFP